MASDSSQLWASRSCLQNVQYRTDVNLAARQSIYAYQRPLIDLPAVVLGLAALHGHETVADTGCGNGAYLAELARRGHAGPLLGVDLSAGMLHSARRRASHAGLVVGDAAALPLPDDACDLALAAHMLYHVPSPPAAVRELRRITRPDGQVLVVLNGEDHLHELRDLITTALGNVTGKDIPIREPLTLDGGAELLADGFTSVTRHDFTGELLIPGPGPVEDYVRSMVITQNLPEPEDLVQAVANLLRDGRTTFRVRTHSGCLVCS